MRSYPGLMLIGLTALLSWSAVVSRADAQNLGSNDDTSVPFRKAKDQFDKFREAKDGALPDRVKDKEMLEVASRHFVFRVTWKTIQAVKWDSGTGMGMVHNDFKELMTHQATATGQNRDLMKMLAPELIARFKDVFGVSFEQYERRHQCRAHAADAGQVQATGRPRLLHRSADQAGCQVGKTASSVYPHVCCQRIGRISRLGPLRS